MTLTMNDEPTWSLCDRRRELTDFDQQSRFQYFTHGLLVSEIPFYRLH